MSNKSMVACNSRCCMLLVLLLLPAMPDAATRRARISTNNSRNINIMNNNNNNNNDPLTVAKFEASKATAAVAASEKLKTSAEGSKYEIRGVAGEPNYKSVNLTWEVEFVTSPSPSSVHDTDANTNGPMATATATATALGNRSGVTNMGDDVQPPKSFQIFYCEMQSLGPQRCRVKLVNGSNAELPQDDAQVQHFAANVDNLRMATRYSFHIRPVQPRRLRISSGRSDFHDENDIEGAAAGQSIIIPTKGFSAHATQCLAHASEIEVETGPYFGGRIVVDGGDCGIKGNAQDPADKYTMRIDHKLCGSMVKPETNTVETFITVQENLGIFTHSTRRFVVVCSYQSGMQTVRASFTVPGKNSGVAAAVEPNDPFQPDDERLGRELRHMRYVNKSELVLKEPDSKSELELESESMEQPALVMETKAPEAKQEPAASSGSRQQGRALSLASLNELNNLAELDVEEAEQPEQPAQGRTLEQLSTKYAKLVVDKGAGASWTSSAQVKAAHRHDDDDDQFYATSLRYISGNLGSVLVTVCISVIIISICVVLLQRHRLRPSSNKRQSHFATHACPTAHLPHKTLPRALQHQQYQCTL